MADPLHCGVGVNCELEPSPLDGDYSFRVISHTPVISARSYQFERVSIVNPGQTGFYTAIIVLTSSTGDE